MSLCDNVCLTYNDSMGDDLRMNILIIDDERPAIKNLERVVKEAEPGAHIYTVEEYDRAIDICHETEIDVAFVDVEMPGMDGITLSGELKNIRPLINIIITTAYEKYSLDAFGIYASGYILKPAEIDEVKDALANLRNTVRTMSKGLYIQCLGNFEVFYDGSVIQFGRSRAKEILAYLIDRNGAAVNNAEICAVLFENDESDMVKQRNYFHHLYNNLYNTLSEYGCENILVKGHNSYSVDMDKINSDYYELLRRNPDVMTGYSGEYMNQYSWAEGRFGL